MTALSLPALFPFPLAALVMAGLVLVEAASLAVGHSASGLVDAILGHDAGHGFGDHGGPHVTVTHGVSPAAWMSWVNVGRVPLLVLLILGLAGFALTGFALQTLAGAVVAPLPPGAAALIAACAMVPALRASSRAMARVMPRDETYAVTADDLVGSIAEVILGPIDTGLPGQVRAVDRHGNIHFLRAPAAENAPAMQTGERVLLVDRAEAVFVAVPKTRDL